MALIPTPLIFVISGMALALGGGFSPAIQALALELYVARNVGKTKAGVAGVGAVDKKDEFETGRLFGALSVASSIS